MTTSMFVELVIIGLIIAIIILLGAVAFIGYDYIIAFIALDLPFGSSVLALGILYALGIICDRISDYVTIPIENKYRVKYGFPLKVKCTPCQVQNLLSGSSSATSCDILPSLCR